MSFELRKFKNTDTGEDIIKLKCPKCGVWADIDDDQLHGRVSVHHDVPECGYHETHDYSKPL